MSVPVTVYPKEIEVIGWKKEVTRGTAETTGFVYYPKPAGTMFSDMLEHIQDENTRGVNGQFPPYAG